MKRNPPLAERIDRLVSEKVFSSMSSATSAREVDRTTELGRVWRRIDLYAHILAGSQPREMMSWSGYSKTMLRKVVERDLIEPGYMRRDGLKDLWKSNAGPNHAALDVAIVRFHSWRSGELPRGTPLPWSSYKLVSRLEKLAYKWEILSDPSETRATAGWQTYNAGPQGRVAHSLMEFTCQDIDFKAEVSGRSLIVYLPPYSINSFDGLLDTVNRKIPSDLENISRMFRSKPVDGGFSLALSRYPTRIGKPNVVIEDDRGAIGLCREIHLKILGDKQTWTDSSNGHPEFESHDLMWGFWVALLPRAIRLGDARVSWKGDETPIAWSSKESVTDEGAKHLPQEVAIRTE